jgi:hypothetical protein
MLLPAEMESERASISTAWAAVVLAAIVLTLLACLHVLSPEFDPSWRVVSEYVNGHYSWVVSLMFVAWASSSRALAYVLRAHSTTLFGKIGIGFLVATGAGRLGQQERERPEGRGPRERTGVRLMARPPQYEREREPWGDAQAVRAAIKRLSPEDRARLLAWLCLYYEDNGGMFSPQISRRRQRIALDGVEYWLVRVPRGRAT